MLMAFKELGIEWTCDICGDKETDEHFPEFWKRLIVHQKSVDCYDGTMGLQLHACDDCWPHNNPVAVVRKTILQKFKDWTKPEGAGE
jgi:hypothetical protein